MEENLERIVVREKRVVEEWEKQKPRPIKMSKAKARRMRRWKLEYHIAKHYWEKKNQWRESFPIQLLPKKALVIIFKYLDDAGPEIPYPADFLDRRYTYSSYIDGTIPGNGRKYVFEFPIWEKGAHAQYIKKAVARYKPLINLGRLCKKFYYAMRQYRAAAFPKAVKLEKHMTTSMHSWMHKYCRTTYKWSIWRKIKYEHLQVLTKQTISGKARVLAKAVSRVKNSDDFRAGSNIKAIRRPWNDNWAIYERKHNTLDLEKYYPWEMKGRQLFPYRLQMLKKEYDFSKRIELMRINGNIKRCSKSLHWAMQHRDFKKHTGLYEVRDSLMRAYVNKVAHVLKLSHSCFERRDLALVLFYYELVGEEYVFYMVPHNSVNF